MTDASRASTAAANGDAVPGEAAPGFSTPASTGKTLSLEDFLGVVPVVLVFLGTLPRSGGESVVTEFNEVFPEFGHRQVQLLIVVPEGPDTVRARRESGTTVPLLADEDGQLLERFASSATFPATVMIDESGLVTRVIEGGRAQDHVASVLAAISRDVDAERSGGNSSAVNKE
jgi:peroxiredoxin